MKRFFATFGLCCVMSIQSFAGWQTNANGLCYINENEQPVINDWVKDGGAWYYMDENGLMKSNSWVNSNNNWYYFGPDGKMYFDKSSKLSGKKYYFDETGAMLHDTYSPDGLLLGSDGAVIEEVDEDSYDEDDEDDEVAVFYFDTDEDSDTTTNTSRTNKNRNSSSGSSSYCSNAYVREVHRLTNNARTKNGRSSLTLSNALCELAAIRAEELVERFSHTRPDGSRCFTVMEGTDYENGAKAENIAMGPISSEQVVTSWLNSAGHRKNIMNSKYKDIGIGFYKSESGTIYWVQLFGKR